MYYIVDRIEKDLAVCEESDSGNMIQIQLEKLPENIKEGDALIKKDNEFFIDEELTEKLRRKAIMRMKQVFGND